MLAKWIESIKDVNEFEKVKLRIEYFKAWGTIISILVPLLAVVVTVAVNMILQERRSRMDFEIKAVEIVMTATSPAAAANKALVLQELFPDRLSSQFHETFERLYRSPNEAAKH